MILLEIATKNKEIINPIIKLLSKEKLAVDITVKKHERIEFVDDEVSTNELFLITGKTKALLYSHIEKRLREEFLNNMPELYSLPITNMDWEQAEKLIIEVKKI